MKPELVTAIVAAVGALCALGNVLLTLRIRSELSDVRQQVLDRVANEYKRQDVCEVEMRALTRLAHPSSAGE